MEATSPEHARREATAITYLMGWVMTPVLLMRSWNPGGIAEHGPWITGKGGPQRGSPFPVWQAERRTGSSGTNWADARRSPWWRGLTRCRAHGPGGSVFFGEPHGNQIASSSVHLRCSGPRLLRLESSYFVWNPLTSFGIRLLRLEPAYFVLNALEPFLFGLDDGYHPSPVMPVCGGLWTLTRIGSSVTSFALRLPVRKHFYFVWNPLTSIGILLLRLECSYLVWVRLKPSYQSQPSLPACISMKNQMVADRGVTA